MNNMIYRKGIVFIAIFILFLPALSGQKRQGIEEKDYKAYLFAYFTGNRKDQEQLHYAVSMDGYNFKTLNNNQPVLDSEKISSTGGIRDPHILRSEDGKTFYMVVTDMVTSLGWSSNRAFVMLKSNDLINWTSSVIHIPQKYGGHEDLLRVWAPQTVYDPEADKYMVYWSMKHGDDNDIIYYAYANEDFTDLIGAPEPLFIPEYGNYCIDGDFVYKNGLFHLFKKTGDDRLGHGIRRSTTQSLTSGKWIEYPEFVESTSEDIEGSCIYKLNNEDAYILMYDVYRRGRYQFTKTTDLENYEVLDEQVSMDFHPRHGTVISITIKELKALLDEWGTPEGLTDLPDNPVLEGFYADPDIIYSHKHNKFYMYPTTDGFDQWSGHYFEAFSSSNLVDWTNEGIILDLQKDVEWADSRAWAPSIIEKRRWFGYRYYYYFTANGFIGAATSRNPAGPFKDSGKRIVAEKPEGINRGAEIDPAVFHDPVSKKDYFYWGNGYLAIAELKNNMVEYDESTLQVHTLPNYREGVTVFYRNGRYYFMWSENDTRSEDYRIRYATSDSPMGPFDIPEENLVLAKDPDSGIYATGHNSVIQIPGRDEWYIVYHRFSYPNGIEMGRAAGYHREVCIDKLEFNADGSVKRVTPTHHGIEPVLQ